MRKLKRETGKPRRLKRMAPPPKAEEQPNLSEIVESLKELQTHRRNFLKARIRLDNQAVSLLKRALGYDPAVHGKKGAKKLEKQARKILADLDKGKPFPEQLSDVYPVIKVFQDAKLPLKVSLKRLEKEMESLAKQLPVWSWVEKVKGVGALSLAKIVGEAGDLSNYSNPAKLWKRFGLAVIDGKAQRRVKGEDALKQGFSPRRRAEAYVLGDCLLKTPDCPYRAYYYQRKGYEESRGLDNKLQISRRAHRYMEKKFLKDLWKAWRA